MTEAIEKKSESCEIGGMKIEVHRSETDGVLVVRISATGDIDLDEDGIRPRARIYINEEAIYENPEFDPDLLAARFGVDVDGEDEEDED